MGLFLTADSVWMGVWMCVDVTADSVWMDVDGSVSRVAIPSCLRRRACSALCLYQQSRIVLCLCWTLSQSAAYPSILTLEQSVICALSRLHPITEYLLCASIKREACTALSSLCNICVYVPRVSVTEKDTLSIKY